MSQNYRYKIKPSAHVYQKGQLIIWPSNRADVLFTGFQDERGRYCLYSKVYGDLEVGNSDSIERILWPKNLDRLSYIKLDRLTEEYPKLRDMLAGGLDLVDCLGVLLQDEVNESFSEEERNNLLASIHSSYLLPDTFNGIEEIRHSTKTGLYYVRLLHDNGKRTAELCVTLDWAASAAPSVVSETDKFHVSEFDEVIYARKV